MLPVDLRPIEIHIQKEDQQIVFQNIDLNQVLTVHQLKDKIRELEIDPPDYNGLISVFTKAINPDDDQLEVAIPMLLHNETAIRPIYNRIYVQIHPRA